MNRACIGVFFVSLASLFFEIALTRLLSITLWHHFAFLIISCALLGYGTAGSWLMLFSRPRHPFYPAFLMSLLLLPLFLLANRIPFDPAMVTLEPSNLLFLCLIFIVLSVPFFFTGLTLTLVLQQFPAKANRIYAFDLVGAAAGCLVFFLLAPAFRELTWLAFASGFALLSALAFSRARGHVLSLTAVVALHLFIHGMTERPALNISEYKSLPLALRHPSARHLETEWNAVSRVDWFYSPMARFAPGLSLNYMESLPDQLGITVDGSRMTAYTSWQEGRGHPFVEYLPSALPFAFDPQPGNALILNVVGGQEVLPALKAGLPEIIVQTENAIVGEWLSSKNRFKTVSVVTEKSRAFLEHSAETFDRIIVSLEGALPTGGTGMTVLQEEELLTMEGIESLYAHLSREGWLSFHRYLLPPPRAEFRLILTIAEVLESRGLKPDQHLGVFRTVSTLGGIVSAGPWTDQEREAFQLFCSNRSYDTVYYPGMDPGLANSMNRFKQPVYASGVRDILFDREAFEEENLFKLEPVTDNRPYFSDFLKLSRLPDFYEAYDGKWEALIETSLLLPVLFVFVLIPASVLLIIPLVLTGRFGTYLPGMTYFFWLGLAFMAVEIAFLQKLTHFLGSPTYSMAIVLSGLLCSSGLGSAVSGRLPERAWNRVLPVLIVLLVFYAAGTATVLDAFAGYPFAVRVFLALFGVSIPGFIMGMPFPAGIAALGGSSTKETGGSSGNTINRQISLAWGFNSFASVIGSVGAMMAILFGGILSLFLWAMLFYGLAALSLRRLSGGVS